MMMGKDVESESEKDSRNIVLSAQTDDNFDDIDEVISNTLN